MESIITALQDMASKLADGSVTVSSLIAQFGTVSQEYRGNTVLTPSDKQFRSIDVVRALDRTSRKPSDVPAHVDLEPVQAVGMETLTGAFGDYTLVPAEEKVPDQAVFYLDMPGKECKVALIAALKDDKVVRITLRRDRRL